MNVSENNRPASAKGQKNGKKTVLTLLAIVLILASALATGAYIVKSTPKANRKKPVKEAPLVVTRLLEASIEQVTISAMGTVIPATELNLQAEVSGRIVGVHKNFQLGSRITYGDKLLMLEPADYQLAVAQAESKVADAAYALAIEEGNQEIALQEWELYDGRENASEKDKELALRKPHLLKAQAEYKSARAELAQAELNLQRTVLYAPFNALVTAKTAEPGGYLSVQQSVATLVGTDRYWVQISLPVDRLGWIDIPQKEGAEGSLVQIHSGDKWKVGTVIKLLGDLEEQGRMARLLVEVDDPLDLKKPAAKREPLLLGEYVRVKIDGKMLDDVVSIPRSALHDGNQIWLVDEEGRLQITAADVLWRDSERVLLRNNLPANSRLVTSNLGSAVSGMQLRLEEGQPKKRQQPQEPDHE
ncbi:RND family efflux transporter, MFP subunit [Malonomonas rubra DSM 5091]|uniref:RND family efflux transporter, MFP subunit n=1 Tax=Malonomonas rubra DSM 5091 TaxID=1122189 RepID=A0A1M6IQA6_MALRU|nr:efflux RND transporter periplasmic adaptor subunit [Malonomonas rubra]SHJ36595.1 RND family efflux transporter, MFP subunit [Malonomonas rubra DSM 5091]